MTDPVPQAADRVSFADSRADFVKRLFAVTLSVGFASQIKDIFFTHSIAQHHMVMLDVIVGNWREVLLLIASLVIVVTSWEGYLAAIHQIELEDWPRFVIDIILVFAYLFLTLSIQAYDTWFAIHVVIYLLYVLWDWARTRLPKYRAELAAHPRRAYELSMSSTLVWFAYFTLIYFLKMQSAFFDTAPGFAAISVAAVAGVFLYRFDKRRRWGWLGKALAFVSPLALMLLAYLGWSGVSG